MWRQRLLTARAGSRAALTFSALWLLAASSAGGAQELLTGVQMDTGLMTFQASPRRSANVTVTELGGRGVTSTVRIAVYGPDERVLTRTEATLQRGQPVTFSYQVTPVTPRLLRFSIVMFGVTGRNTQPVVTLEDVDDDRITIGQRISCSLPADRSGPVTPYCPPVVIRNLTFGG